VIGCSTIEWVKEYAGETMLKGGFWGRFLICPAEMPDEHEIKWWAEKTGNQRFFGQIVERLRVIRNNSPGESLRFENGFRPQYENWCKDMYRTYAKSPVSESLGGASARSPFNNLKIASLFEISKNPDAKVITIESGLEANHFMNYILECLELLIGTEFVEEREQKRRIVRNYFLKLRGEEDKIVLRKYFQPQFSPYGIDRYQLDDFLIDMEAEGIITLGKSRRYRGRAVVSELTVNGTTSANKD
jgi:hypothetical protein